MVAFEAKSFNELLSRPSQQRELLGFSAQSSEVPDYAELGVLSSLE